MKTISIKIIFISVLLFPIYLFAQDDFSSQSNFLTLAERKELINRNLDKFNQNKVEHQDVENIGKDYIPVMHFSYLFSVKTFMLKEHKNHFVDFTSFVRITQ